MFADGGYLLLLMHCRRNGALQDDDKFLAGVARVPRAEWARDAGSVVRQFSPAKAGRLHQKRMEVERDRATEVSTKKKAAAAARWAAKAENSECIPDTNAYTHARTCASASISLGRIGMDRAARLADRIGMCRVGSTLYRLPGGVGARERPRGGIRDSDAAFLD